MSFKQSFIFTLLCALVIAAAFFSGYFTHARYNAGDNFPVLVEAHALLQQYGLPTPPPGRALEYGMVRGMIQAYGDPFTSFNEPVQAELQSNNLQGSFGGIGAGLGRDADNYPILLPFPDGPAALAGVQEGDRLLAVDGVSMPPETTAEAIQAAIRGPVGVAVTLSLGRPPGYSPFDVSVERAEFPLPSVTWNLEPRQPLLGVIKVNLIASSTADEVQKAVTDLQSRGATHFALDLRDNFGGLLDAGVDVARLFLKEGIVIQETYKNEKERTHAVEGAGPLADLPLVVLVNSNTASAAEIIAGALQAQQRGPLIGVPTFGKDTLQVVFQLQDGSSIQISGGRWWVPGLDLPRARQGLQPNILVDPPSGDPDPVILKAIEVLFP